MEWLITFTTYATHFHDSPKLANWESAHAAQPPYLLDAPRRAVVLQSIQSACANAGWRLLAAHVRTNHVHVVVSATHHQPSRIMTYLKAQATAALNQRNLDAPDRRRWTRHGSTRPIENLPAAITYVVDAQGPKLDCYERLEPQPPEPRTK